MPVKTPAVIDALGALAHEHRLAIYRLLVQRGPEGLAAGVIGQRVRLLPSSLTFHLQNLQRAGLIRYTRGHVTIVDRMDYSAPIYNELAWHGAAEKLMGIELTPRTKVLRIWRAVD